MRAEFVLHRGSGAPVAYRPQQIGSAHTV